MFFYHLCEIALYYFYYLIKNKGVSSDFWCWINDDYLDDWAWKMLYIEVGVFVIILFLLYFVMKIHLKRFIEKSSNIQIDIDNNENNSNLILNRSRLSFVRTISGGLSSYLFAPFIAFIPGHFNIICASFKLEWNEHVLSWYILSGILLGVLHIGIYVCGISIVRYSWSACCNNDNKNNINHNKNNNDNLNVMMHQRQPQQSKKEFINRTLQQSQKHYMELV